MSPAPSGGKRGRVPDPEEDVYVDNLHSHKRYLTEVRPSVRLSLSVMRCEHNNFGSAMGQSPHSFVRRPEPGGDWENWWLASCLGGNAWVGHRMSVGRAAANPVDAC